jgi:CheY-like chemotaxis protein
MNNGQKTILIVDDEPDIVLAIATILADAGYAVTSATRRESLMQRLCQESLPDLILLDMLLSGQRGTEITEELKQHQETRHIPILMLSAHPDAEQEARTAGADGFIPKPFDLDDLLATVATFL